MNLSIVNQIACQVLALLLEARSLHCKKKVCPAATFPYYKSQCSGYMRHKQHASAEGCIPDRLIPVILSHIPALSRFWTKSDTLRRAQLFLSEIQAAVGTFMSRFW